MNVAATQGIVVMGAGPGLGQACCRLFAQRGHPVALLSRSQSKLDDLAKQINDEVGDEQRTRPYAVDVTKKEDVDRVFSTIQRDWKERGTDIHTAIFNAGGLFKMKPFLETTEEDFRSVYDVQIIGSVHFAQAYIRSLQQTSAWSEWKKDPTSTTPVGNLLFSGATAALRGSVNLSAMSSSSFALRSLSQSIAREFMPQGVHVAHFILDGLINTPRSKGMLGGDFEANSRLEPDHVAQVYYDTTQQKRSAWAFETDLRPAKEKW